MRSKYTPSEAELEILKVLWKIEPATVRQLHEVLAMQKNVGYTTTLKQVQRLFEKGILTRKPSGKSHLYTTDYKEDNAKTKLFGKLKDTLFNGSVMDLVMHALGEEDPTLNELDQLEKFLKEIKKNKK